MNKVSGWYLEIKGCVLNVSLTKPEKPGRNEPLKVVPIMLHHHTKTNPILWNKKEDIGACR
jgi:hypothetical protein